MSFFTNGGRSMPRIRCLLTASGSLRAGEATPKSLVLLPVGEASAEISDSADRRCLHMPPSASDLIAVPAITY